MSSLKSRKPRGHNNSVLRRQFLARFMRRNLAFYDCDTVSTRKKKKKRKEKEKGNKGNKTARQRKQEYALILRREFYRHLSDI